MKAPICILLTALCCALPGCAPRSEPEALKPSGEAPPEVVAAPALRRVLCLASEDLKGQGLDHIEARALDFYREAGFELVADYYQRVDADTLNDYAAVIGMMPMLHAGTRAISPELGQALEDYIRGGGGFALLPAPSYYGVTDYAPAMNPFLSRFGAELLNEQPRDAAHQRTIPHIIAYRYLQTTNITTHAVTAGLDSLWLPLDYTDAYILTHTFEVNDDWTVLVRGNDSTASYTYASVASGRPVLGTYPSAPPFLAVRTLDKGRMALFATSSQYFIFDAFHRAFDQGFVMREGGGRLMTQLLDWLTDTGVSRPVSQTAIATNPSPSSNVPVMPDKQVWRQLISKQAAKRDRGVERYIDCGSLNDLPWSPERQAGYDPSSRSWPVRWSWTEVFHATASNARGFRQDPLTYVFSGLRPGVSRQLGVLLWAPRPGMTSYLKLRLGDKEVKPLLSVPNMEHQEGPYFHLIDVPDDAIDADGRLTVTFERGTPTGADAGAVNELWLFGKGVGNRSLTDLEPAVPESAGSFETPPVRTHFKGLIGARTAASGGSHTAEELAAAARESGLDFLVFLEDAKAFSPEAWTAFSAECDRLSGPDFRAVPGVAFEAGGAATNPRADQPQSHGSINAYVFQQLEKLPEPGDYARAHALFWKFFGGQLSGGHGAPPTLLTPSRNSISPYYQRFWRGFNLITQDAAGAILDDARAQYAGMIASGYGPQPRASGVYETPAQVQQAAATGWLTLIESPSLARIESFHYASSVSNGPDLLQWQLTFDHSRDTGTGGGILFVDSVWVFVHAHVRHEAGLRKVTLYDGTQPIRIWYPGGQPEWSVSEPLRVSRHTELWLKAEGVDGRELYTGRIVTQENTFQLGMCGDNQNTIGNLTVTPTEYVRNERAMYQPHAYWHTGQAAGQLGVMLNPDLHVPRVIETGIIQPVKTFHPTPLVHLADGSREDHELAELRILSADRNHNRIEYRFEQPGCLMRSRTVLTTFRPSQEGATVVLVESELQALRDLDLSGGIERLRVALLPELSPDWNYAFRRAEDGQRIEGAFPYDQLGTWSLHAKLGPDRGLWFGPGDIAALMVIPLDGETYGLDLRLLAQGRAREYAGFTDERTHLTAGITVRARFLVLLQPGPDRTVEHLDALVDHYHALPTRFSDWTSAEVRPDTWPARVKVQGGGTVFAADTSGLVDPLPLMLYGLNPNWDTLLCAGDTTHVGRPARDGVWPVAIDPGPADQTVFAGHPVLADDPNLILEWGGVEQGHAIFHAFNRSEQPGTTHVHLNPLWPGTGSSTGVEVRLEAGAGAWYRIPLETP